MMRHHRIALIFSLLALFPVFRLTAQAQSDGTPPPPFNGIAHVAIRVHDLGASVAFYQKLGFEQAFDLRKNDVPYESFVKINDNQFLELYPTTERDPAAGFLHLCFEGADLDAIYDDYVARGLTPTAVRKAGAGNLLFTLVGPGQPSGPQNIEYTQYMPGSLHSNDQGKHLGPDRVADQARVGIGETKVDHAPNGNRHDECGRGSNGQRDQRQTAAKTDMRPEPAHFLGAHPHPSRQSEYCNKSGRVASVNSKAWE